MHLPWHDDSYLDYEEAMHFWDSREPARQRFELGHIGFDEFDVRVD